MVTTNLPFDEWTEVFGSERLTGALLDRLTHHVHILEMNGESYRLKRSRENAAAQAPERIRQPISRARSRPHSLTHPPSLLPACLCDTPPMENVTLTQKEQARLQVLNSLLAEHMTLDRQRR